MAEGRFLSRAIAYSEQLANVSLYADYLFVRIIPHLDVEGRIGGSAKSIRARVVPLRAEMTEEVVADALAELDRIGLVIWYEVDGSQYLEFPTFTKHQQGLRKDREATSKVPARSNPDAHRVLTPSRKVAGAPTPAPPPDYAGSRTGAVRGRSR